MRFIGIDIASQTHVVAILADQGQVLLAPKPFGENHGGYSKLKQLIGSPDDALVLFEATGHYWKNLAASLAASGFRMVLLNPLRTHRFAESDLIRTKTDSVDALTLARFGQQKRPDPTVFPDAATEELKELVRHQERLQHEFGDHTRQLHRLVDLGFPEFTTLVQDLGSPLATTILAEYPTAKTFAAVRPKTLANLKYGRNSHTVGVALAKELVELAKVSVGAHHAAIYQLQVKHACEDLNLLRARLLDLDRDIDKAVEQHEVGKLLTTIDGIGTLTSARLIAELGNPARFKSAEALAAYVGVVPALKQSGKSRGMKAGISRVGNGRLRAMLYMPVMTAVRYNAWLKHHYERWLAAGHKAKSAYIACMRKLLHAIYSVATNLKPFVPRLPTQPSEATA